MSLELSERTDGADLGSEADLRNRVRSSLSIKSIYKCAQEDDGFLVLMFEPGLVTTRDDWADMTGLAAQDVAFSVQ